MRSTMDGQPESQPDGQLDAPALLDRLRERSTAELEAMFRDLDTLHNATDAHRMLMLAVLDERDVGREDGALDTTGWVTWTARVTRARARALVETARALPERPEIATVALQGRLSGEQLESLVQVATPDTDQQWASDGPGWSASSLRAASRNRRAVTTEEAVEGDRRRELGFRWNEARGELRLWGRIPDVDGALVALALTKDADAVGPDADGHWDPFPTRCADVLVASLSRDQNDGDEASRATVVVHAPEAAFARSSDAPGAYVDGVDAAVPLANETVRRVACDAIRQKVVEDARGVPIALGRRTRTVPAHLFRLLKHRDRHCRAPGCRRTRGLHAHHRVHWSDGGTTDLDNLILLCSRHHHLVHEHGWEIRGDLRHPETVELRHRDGRLIAPVRPPPLAPAARERFLVTTA